MKRLIVYALMYSSLILYVTPALSAVKVFDNAFGDHKWSTAGNWEGSIPPNFTDTVRVEGDSVFFDITIGITALVLENSTLEIDALGTLQIAGGVTGITCTNSQIINRGALDIQLVTSYGILATNSSISNRGSGKIEVSDFENTGIYLDDLSRLNNRSNASIICESFGADIFGPTALENQNIIMNSGLIWIKLSHEGIVNGDTLINHGKIQIDTTSRNGITNNENAYLENNDSIVVGNSKTKVLNSKLAFFNNKVGSFLQAFDMHETDSDVGIRNFGMFDNYGDISLNGNYTSIHVSTSTSGEGGAASAFLNYSSIIIKNTAVGLLVNGSMSIFENHGNVEISKCNKTNKSCIENSSVFTNKPSGVINISEDVTTATLSAAIQSSRVLLSDLFLNEGIIEISEMNRPGIINQGDMINENSIHIYNSTSHGIVNEHMSGNFINESNGVVTLNNIAQIGIMNHSPIEGAIKMENNGIMNLSNIDSTGIQNGEGDVEFINNNILNLSLIGDYSILNTETAIFTNSGEGKIKINNDSIPSSLGILNMGEFYNNGNTKVNSSLANGLEIRESTGKFYNTGILHIYDCPETCLQVSTDSFLDNQMDAEILISSNAGTPISIDGILDGHSNISIK